MTSGLSQETRISVRLLRTLPQGPLRPPVAGPILFGRLIAAEWPTCELPSLGPRELASRGLFFISIRGRHKRGASLRDPAIPVWDVGARSRQFQRRDRS